MPWMRGPAAQAFSVLPIQIADSVFSRHAYAGSTIVGYHGLDEVCDWVDAGFGDGIGLGAALIVAAASSVDLVVGFVPAAALHHDLKNRFIALEQAIIQSHGDSLLGEHQRLRLDIEKDEPPIRRALCRLVHNELIMAEYSATDASQHLLRVPILDRLTAQLFEHANVSR